jgi:hypothetical protein
VSGHALDQAVKITVCEFPDEINLTIAARAKRQYPRDLYLKACWREV